MSNISSIMLSPRKTDTLGYSEFLQRQQDVATRRVCRIQKGPTSLTPPPKIKQHSEAGFDSFLSRQAEAALR